MFRSRSLSFTFVVLAAGLVITGCSKKGKSPMANLKEPVGQKSAQSGGAVNSNSSSVREIPPVAGNPWGPDGGVPSAESGGNSFDQEFAGGLDDSMVDDASNGIKQNANTENVDSAIEIADLDMVHFEYDSSTIKPSWHSVLDEHAKWLMNNPSVHVQIEGHCDERGTEEYNIALGQRRADAIREYLISQGVSSTRLSTISYGKMRPISFESSTEAHSLNRRGMFLVYTPDDSTATAGVY
jgi:peptidoglycan-associated lipoprotein